MNFALSMIVGILLGAVIGNMGIGLIVGLALWMGVFKLWRRGPAEPERDEGGGSQP